MASKNLAHISDYFFFLRTTSNKNTTAAIEIRVYLRFRYVNEITTKNGLEFVGRENLLFSIINTKIQRFSAFFGQNITKSPLNCPLHIQTSHLFPSKMPLNIEV